MACIPVVFVFPASIPPSFHNLFPFSVHVFISEAPSQVIVIETGMHPELNPADELLIHSWNLCQKEEREKQCSFSADLLFLGDEGFWMGNSCQMEESCL